MKTVKEVSEITGLSVRTLRYYDEIGLLKPAGLTESGYRLYDETALEKLREIMFFRELEIPLADIKEIMERPDRDIKQALSLQKSLLEQKRNRLNGMIELIGDEMEHAGTMNFKAFDDDDIDKIMNHSLELQGKESITAIIREFGSVEAYRDFFAENMKNEKMSGHFMKMYGSKNKAVEASLKSTGDRGEHKKLQDENDRIYRQFARAMESDDEALAMEAVRMLSENYKSMFRMDNARYLLLKVAEDYLEEKKVPELIEATEKKYGQGITEYIGRAIRRCFGE